MSTQVVPFLFETKNSVRVIVIDGDPWFVATDVAAALDYRNAPDMTRFLDDDEKGTHILRTLGDYRTGELCSDAHGKLRWRRQYP